MDRPISPAVHGAIDYSTIAATAAAPKLLGFPENASRAAYALAGGYLLLSALTDYPPALKRAIPLKAHGATDVALAAAIPAMPWLMGFAKNQRARNFFLGLTAITVVVTALTNWSPEKRRRRRTRD